MVLAQWVLSMKRISVPQNITIRLISVKYLTSLKGLTFSSDELRSIDNLLRIQNGNIPYPRFNIFIKKLAGLLPASPALQGGVEGSFM